jgi:ATP:ADP antiporter, AAA family
MTSPGAVLRKVFDIRRGEHLRLWSMFLYLLFVLFAYYIVKPVSRAMFLTRFDIDKLPLLYILIAVFGGILAYFYSKAATRTSLSAAVTWAMGLSALTLVIMWWLTRMRLPWMVYVLNIWVSLFSVILVSQGWLVASNLFNAREAKRLYPILDMGMVLGAALGGEFTRRAVVLIGTESLLLASALMVLLAYLAFLVASRRSGDAVREAHAARHEEADFSFGQMMNDLARVRHLRIIVGMMIVMYLVDTFVEYQFQAMARTVYTGDKLTAFFGQFYGLWLNGVEFVFQLFLTGLVVRWFGVGATLQISPVAVGVSSIAILGVPGVASASAVRLTEASTRYTLSKTGMELLYLPLPLALRNRVKAFIDICVDRLSRGIGGVLLLFLTAKPLHLGVKGIAVVVIALSVVWIVYSQIARREYVASIRSRLARHRLDLESTRVAVTDAATIEMLEKAALGINSRQSTYALELLSHAPRYDIARLLHTLADNRSAEVRNKVYEVAAQLRYGGLLEAAGNEIRAPRSGDTPPRRAAAYLLAMSPSRDRLAAELLNSGEPGKIDAALEGLRLQTDLAREVISSKWLDEIARSDDPNLRALAATAIAVRGDRGEDALHKLLYDRNPKVVSAAISSAGQLRDRAYLYPLIHALENSRFRGEAIAALSAFGPAIAGTLSDVLNDETAPARIRREIPRVLKNVPDQRSVTALLSGVGHPDLTIRDAVLKALNRLRESAPQLNFDDAAVTRQLLNEARDYYELSSALAPFRTYLSLSGHRSAPTLLARTIDNRLQWTLARVFRLLGLRYPPKDIYSAYLAVSKRDAYESAAALEFLDNVLDHNLKRVLLPLLDAPQYVLDRGRELFGVEPMTAEQAIRKLIQSGDPWLVSCAISAAVELAIRSLGPEIAKAGETAAPEVSRVAQSAQLALA